MTRVWTYSLLIFVMLVWGLNVVAVKFLIEYFPPIAMQGFRILVAAVVALVVLYFLRDLRKLTGKEWGYLIVASIFGQAAHHTLLAVGLVETTAANGSLILGLIPLTTSIFAIIFLHDRLSLLRFIGIISGFVGVAFVVMQNNGGLAGIAQGDVLVFISMVSQAFSFILIKKVTHTLSSRQATAVMLGIGSLFILGTSLTIEPNGIAAMTAAPWWVWAIFFSSAIISTGLGHMLFNAAIQHIGAGQSAIFNNLVPFFALIGSYLFLGEQIFVTQMVGFIFIVIGVLLGTGYVDQRLQKRYKAQHKQNAHKSKA